MKLIRLFHAILHGIRRSYGVWQMDEVTRQGKELYSCVQCGMARSEPCEHWQAMIDDYAREDAGRE